MYVTTNYHAVLWTWPHGVTTWVTALEHGITKEEWCKSVYLSLGTRNIKWIGVGDVSLFSSQF